MAWVLWTLVLCQLAFLNQAAGEPKAIIHNDCQVIVERYGETYMTYDVTLDGSHSLKAVSYRWSQQSRPDDASDARFTNRDAAVTNVTIDRDVGKYEFRLRVKDSMDRRNDASTEVVVKDAANIGMHVLSNSVVTKLLEMQYMYLSLSYHYRRADNFKPNVATYYRALSSSRASMLDEVMKYILAKQATIDLLSSCPPDHVKTMMTTGLRETIEIAANVTEMMTSSFETAIGAEKKLGADLALISHLADKNNDHDLSEFAAADLIPEVTKVINGHKNHLETILRAVKDTPHRHLAEFLFDKYLTVPN